jgi:hypothetical protein
MRSLGIFLIIAGFLGLAYYAFAFVQVQAEHITPGNLLFLMSDRICGCIASAAATIVGGLFLMRSTSEEGFAESRRQLNSLQETFTYANKPIIEENDGIIRNATDLKKDRELRKFAETDNTAEG